MSIAGNLFLIAGICFASGQQAVAQITFQTLLSFPDISNGPERPYATVIQGSDGALYGTSSEGGSVGGGTVYKLNTDGSGLQVLHSFPGASGDGAQPGRALIQGADGKLYGTTDYGGSGSGTAFSLNTDGSQYAILHVFGAADGGQPTLIQGKDGALYGTAVDGGSADLGTVFKLNTDGSGFQVLHNFTGSSDDGENPCWGLLQGRDGVLYGTTVYGGVNGVGTVFKINTDGTGFNVLYSLASTGNGRIPQAPLFQGSDGYLYGTTGYGPSGTDLNGSGTIFKIKTDGTGYAVIHTFGGSSDGNTPMAALTQDSTGALYGTAAGGGTGGQGTTFKINTDGSGFQLLHSFSGTGGEGSGPWALCLAKNGSFYSTTWGGGTSSQGTLLALLASQAPTIVQQPANQTACPGTLVSFMVIASGTVLLTYQWQVSTDGGTTWNNISGATSSTLSVTAETSLAGYQYKVLVTNGGGTTPSYAATLTVNPPPMVSVNSPIICSGDSATLTATTSSANPFYSWSPGGATTASITVSPTSTTTYTVSVIDGTTGCSGVAFSTVTVNQRPPMDWVLGQYAAGDNTSDNLAAITFGGELFVTLGYAADTTFYSPNGIAPWPEGGTGLGNAGAHLTGVGYANGRYVAVGEYGDSFTSYDGINWVGQNENNTGLSCVAGGPISGGDYLYVAVGPAGRVQTAPYAASGFLTWTANYPVSGNPNLNAVAAASGQPNAFIAVGDSGTIITSPGTGGVPAWQAQTSGTSENLYGVTYGGGLYVAVGDAGTILTSPDGATWSTVVYSASANPLRAVAWGNGLFVAVGDGGWTVLSSDGVHWTGQSSITGNNLTGIAYNNGTFIAIGANGTIIESIAPILNLIPAGPGSFRLQVTGAPNTTVDVQFSYSLGATAYWFVWATATLDSTGSWESGINGDSIGTEFYRAKAIPACQ